MFRHLLYSHTRNINAFVYAKKVLYQIPLYNDSVNQNVLSARIKDGTLFLELERPDKMCSSNIRQDAKTVPGKETASDTGHPR